jgi:hypothetical protein
LETTELRAVVLIDGNLLPFFLEIPGVLIKGPLEILGITQLSSTSTATERCSS